MKTGVYIKVGVSLQKRIFFYYRTNFLMADFK